MTAITEGTVRTASAEQFSRTAGESRPIGYIVGAICVAVSTIMLAPLVLSFFASIKPPDEARATPPTFRASYEHLRRDLGDAGLAVAALLALGVAAWAAVDLAHAHHGYFRLARFHAHLEIMAGTLLLLERSRLQERPR